MDWMRLMINRKAVWEWPASVYIVMYLGVTVDGIWIGEWIY
jgi:hypothetical protein